MSAIYKNLTPAQVEGLTESGCDVPDLLTLDNAGGIEFIIDRALRGFQPGPDLQPLLDRINDNRFTLVLIALDNCNLKKHPFVGFGTEGFKKREFGSTGFSLAFGTTLQYESLTIGHGADRACYKYSTSGSYCLIDQFQGRAQKIAFAAVQMLMAATHRGRVENALQLLHEADAAAERAGVNMPQRCMTY